MNILHFTLGFYPAVAWGGPVKIVHQNCKELVRRGHQVTIYCSNLLNKHEKIKPHTFEQQTDGIRVVYFDTCNFSWWKGTLGPAWLKDFPVYLKRELKKFDIVHINGYRNPMILPLIFELKKQKKPAVMQPHGAMPVIVNSFFVKRIYDKLFGKSELNAVTTLIAGQESERQQALSHGFPSERIEIVPNGLDFKERILLSESGTFRKMYQIPFDSKIILFLARINRKKGTDMLIESFNKIRNIGAHLVIAGPDDGQLEEVKGLIQKYQLNQNITLTGLLNQEKVLLAFQDADIFVLPCRTDTFPFAMIESCLSETPMVVTDRCEISHLVKDRVAEVVPFDAEAFAQAMKRLLTDHKRYDFYRSNCPKIMTDTFSITAVADKLEKIYENAIARNRGENKIKLMHPTETLKHGTS